MDSQFVALSFIDGTVAGTSIVITSPDRLKSNTYFGGGCDNNIENPSTVSCSIATEDSHDGEAQSIGSFFNFQAATAGSAFIEYSDNTNTPDTFCPLGWQLPYSGRGGDYYNKSKSWLYLFQGYGIIHNREGMYKMTSYPFSYIQSGIVSPAVGVYRMGDAGYFYSKTVADYWNGYGFRPVDWDSGPNVTFDNQAELSIRCFAPSSTAR